MGLRAKFVVIMVVSLLIGSGVSILMPHLNLHGYALLPFVIIAGLSFYIAFGALAGIIAPRRGLVRDSFVDLLLYALFSFLVRH